MDYSDLVVVYDQLEQTTKRLEKTACISELLKNTPDSDLNTLILLLQGKLYPAWEDKKIGMSEKLVLKSLVVATGLTSAELTKLWKETGDLGDVARKSIARKKQSTLVSSKLSVKKVFDNLRKLSSLEGAGTVDRKVKLVAELLTSALSLEAKYIVRTVLEDLRIGTGEGVMRDSIMWAYFGEDVGVVYNSEKNKIDLPENSREEYNTVMEAVQHAYDILNDFSEVAACAKEKGIEGLKTVELRVGKPVKVMLAQKVATVADGFKRVGTPCQIEYKYDGFRMQVHKKANDVTIFTRRLENVTAQFPEVVDFILEHVNADECVLDAEAIGYDPKTKKYLPFQHVSQRIKRKYDIDKVAQKFPVELNVFDILSYNGKTVIDEPQSERFKLVNVVVEPAEFEIKIAKGIVSEEENEVQYFYEDAVNKGMEGVMLKTLDAPYKPGSRVGFMVKLKPVLDSLDLVIVGADWGEGKRAHWLTSLHLACKDEDGNLLEIGKLGTGLKELETEEGTTFSEITELLKPLIKHEEGLSVTVSPEVVIEVSFEEIQVSPTYSSGYALRFPRFVNLRSDRGLDDIATLDEIKEAFKTQKGGE